MTDALGAGKSERTGARLGYRSGYYTRTLVTRVGKLELRVPQDRDGRFSTELFERYQRSEQALVATLAEMYVQGVSTRKVKAITEEMPVLPFRSVLLRRENESVILNVELTGMADDVAVLSGTETTIRLIPDVLAAIGNNRGAFRDEFVRRVNAAKENK